MNHGLSAKISHLIFVNSSRILWQKMRMQASEEASILPARVKLDTLISALSQDFISDTFTSAEFFTMNTAQDDLGISCN
jgi:hypothetical protein